MLGQISITADALCALRVDETLSVSDKLECHAYSRVLSAKGEECRVDGNIVDAESWHVLAQIADMMFGPSNTSEPFAPMAVWEGRRTIIPSDLKGVVGEAIGVLGLRVRDPEFRGRLLDIAWESNRDCSAAVGAVEAYLASARRLMDPDDWVPYVERCERSLRLAVSLGRGDLKDSVLSEIEGTVLSLDGEDPMYLTCRLVALLLEFRFGDLDRLAFLCDKAATVARDAMGFERARVHLSNLEVCRRILGDGAGVRSAKERFAACLEDEGVLHLESGNNMAAADRLEKAHVAYREIPDRGKAGDVYVMLRTAQQGVVDSMTTLELPATDFSDVADEARAWVRGYSFADAWWRLLMIHPPINFDDVGEAVRTDWEDSVWLRLAARSTLDSDGRVVARGSSWNSEGSEESTWEDLVRYASWFQQMFGSAIIRPAVQQVMLEHAPCIDDVYGVVWNSPLVPLGHEGWFVKGILSGLRGDMVGAMSVLLPQFENGLRHLLSGEGVEVSSMDKMGYQDVFQMGRILSLEALVDVLGDDLVKEMRILFTDRYGPRLRDRMSHGLMPSDEFYSDICFYAWWLICYVCFSPSLARRVNASSQDGVGGVVRC